MTVRAKARKAARHALSPRTLLDSGPVCIHGGVVDIPDPEFPPGHRPEEMDMRDVADVDRWLVLHNDAFGRRWGRDQFRESVLEHPHYDIRRTFFLCDPRGPIGAVSIGVFRRNPAIGVGHYLAIAPRSQRLGLGQQLGYYRSHSLRELGVTRAEAETRIGRPGSVWIWFSCGWEPKFELDHWNTPDGSPALVRAITKRRLERLHREWKRKHSPR